MTDPFSNALDFVVEALSQRQARGAECSASVGSVSRLLEARRGVSAGAHTLGGEVGLSSPAPKVFSENALGRGRVKEPAEEAGEIPGDKAEALLALRAEVLGCVRCPNLVSSRTNVVFGVGNPDAELMFVGEAPGADEDLRGEPFVGAAGELLDKMMQAMGFARGEVYIANVLKCRPDVPAGTAGNRKPAVDEIERCLPYLRRQIAVIRPRVMVALGATAMQGLFGKTEAMAKMRSNWYEFEGIPVMATYHPSYLLRTPALSERRKVWEDLLQVLERLEKPISAKQRGFFLKPQG